MGVPHVVYSALEAGLLKDPSAGTAKVRWPPQFTVRAGEDEIVTVETGTHAQAHLALCLAVLTQGVAGDRGEGDGARRAPSSAP